MKYVKVPETTFDSLIEGLESALKVCYNVDSMNGDCERTYPYAVGYSRATMQEIIRNLEYLKSQSK